MIDFICFILLAIVAFGVGIWAGKEVDAPIGVKIGELEGGNASLFFIYSARSAKLEKLWKLRNCGIDVAAPRAKYLAEFTDTVPVILYYLSLLENKKEPRINVALL